tara:strand:- start:112 stop:1053 length:942 start_codon:yes stop_codon:yes gene_type:complete
MNAMTHQFCSVESVRAGDPLAGTATHAARNLLISWPRSKWSRSLRKAKDMDEALAQQLDQLAADGRRVNLITRRRWPAEVHRVYLFPEARYFDIPRQKLGEFLTALEADGDLSPWKGHPASAPLMLCCTHGKKDKCCAKFGNAAYQALARTARQENMPVEIWESSHLGGCRLAASVMVFPAMRKYGRMAPEQVLPFLRHEVADIPYLPCYRGHSLLTPAQQCAETAALGWLEAQEISANVSVMPESREDGTDDVMVTVDWQTRAGNEPGDDADSGTLLVLCGTIEVLRLDTCADLDEGPSPSRCWIAKKIEPQ